MYMCVYVRMYVLTYVHLFVRTYVHLFVRTYVHMCACMHVCVYTYTYICMYGWMDLCVFMYVGTKACGSCEEVSEFLDQATLLRGISHQNILAVMGLCSDDHQAPIIMYSYPSIGNLHTFLTAHKQATSATRQKGVRKNLCVCVCVVCACVGVRVHVGV